MASAIELWQLSIIDVLLHFYIVVQRAPASPGSHQCIGYRWTVSLYEYRLTFVMSKSSTTKQILRSWSGRLFGVGAKAVPQIDLDGIARGKKIAIFLDQNSALAERLARTGPTAVFLRGEKQKAPNGLICRTYEGIRSVKENNAEILFLGGRSRVALRPKAYNSIAHAEYVIVRNNFSLVFFSYFLQRHLARKRLKFIGFLSGTSKLGDWLVFENLKHEIGPRFFFNSKGDEREFFSKLIDLKYSVVKGSFGPNAPEYRNSCLTLLADDTDVKELTRRVTRGLGFEPIEIYTPFSVPGHALPSHVSYFPPLRALEILGRSLCNAKSDAPHLAPPDQLLACCYSLLFHKDISLPNGIEGLDLFAKCDSETLHALCDRAQMQRFSTLDEIELFLKDKGWFPSAETLAFLARDNAFIRTRYIDLTKYKPGLVVFVLRELALKRGLIETITAMIQDLKFEILESNPIPEELKTEVAARFRGGNWSLPPEAGGPSHFIVAIDRNPIPVDPKLFVDAIATDNGRLVAKRAIRKRLARMAKVRTFNAVHSSDNSEAALEYVAVLRPDMYAAWKSLVEKSE